MITAKQENTEQNISDAYIYLLARLLIARQQQIDFDRRDFNGIGSFTESRGKWTGRIQTLTLRIPKRGLP